MNSGPENLAKEPRNAITRYFVEQIGTQRKIIEELKGIGRAIVSNALDTGNLPSLSMNAFLILNGLAQVRANLLDKNPVRASSESGNTQGAAVVAHLNAICDAIIKDANLQRSLEIAQMKDGFEKIFAGEPFNSSGFQTLDHMAPEYRNAVRDRLIEITKLELAVMRYVNDSSTGMGCG